MAMTQQGRTKTAVPNDPTRRVFLKMAAAAGAAMGLGVSHATAAAPHRQAAQSAPTAPPNIVLILVDDLGYGDIGCYGAEDIRTPHIDRMAAEGVRFTDFYVAAPSCSPSRAALLTGSYPQRVNITNVLFPEHNFGLNPDEITIADLLKERGYATACVGKWHLGHREEFMPPRQGFEVYFGIPYSNDMSPDPQHHANPHDPPIPNAENFPPLPLIRGNEVVETEPDQALLTRRFTEESIAFIEQNRDRPFFLYLAHVMPHIPLFPSEPFRGRSQRGLYGDVVEELDWSVGEILTAIKRLGLDENTLVIFTSDNGPWVESDYGGVAGPLRGGKGSAFEGGMRVPCVMRWPGAIPAGITSDEIAATIDFLPTFAQMAGAEVPTDRVIDGKDILPLMVGEPDARTPHDAYYFWTHFGLQAMRAGEWKLHIDRQQRPTALYNLRDDIGEQNNVLQQETERVQQLHRRALSHHADVERHARPRGQVP
jgi:arylsulfatase A